MRTHTSTRWTRVPVICVLAMLTIVAAIPAGSALAEPEQPKPVESALEQLANVLGRLEAELAALEAPAAERLEEGLERIIELIAELLDEVGQPQDDEDGASVRARIVRLDLMLHRLLYVLDEIVEHAKESPARPRARGTLDDLRGWVDGYIDGATADMSPRAAARFEEATRDMVRSMAEQLAAMARRAQGPDRGRPILARLVERLEELLFRLDGFILKPASPPDRE